MVTNGTVTTSLLFEIIREYSWLKSFFKFYRVIINNEEKVISESR